MNLKELTQEYLRKEGFCPEETEFGLYFKCEGKNYLLIYDDDDQHQGLYYARKRGMARLRSTCRQHPCCR